MASKFGLGIAVSAVFVYLTLRGVDFPEVWAGLQDKRFVMLLPVVATFITCQITKSLRWGIILSAIRTIKQPKLFPIACVGYMAIIVLPMRLGEVVRPYLLTAKHGVPMGSGFATVLVERLLDVAVLLLFFFFVLTCTSLPHPVARAGMVLLGLVVIEFVLIAAIALWPEKMLRLLAPFRRYMPSVGQRIERFAGNLAAGFRMISCGRKLLQSAALSLAVWGFSALAVYFLFLFSNLPFGPIEALGVTSITALGISLPAAPGLVGNFQFACIVALSLWGVGKTEAFTYAMVYYAMGVGINILLGIAFMPVVDMPLRKLLASRNRDAVDKSAGESVYSKG